MAEKDKIETTNTDQQGISLGDNLFKNYKINWGRYNKQKIDINAS